MCVCVFLNANGRLAHVALHIILHCFFKLFPSASRQMYLSTSLRTVVNYNCFIPLNCCLCMDTDRHTPTQSFSGWPLSQPALHIFPCLGQFRSKVRTVSLYLRDWDSLTMRWGVVTPLPTFILKNSRQRSGTMWWQRWGADELAK